MNVFASLARSFWNAVDFRKKPAEGEAPKKARAASRLREGFERVYRSAFSPASRGDGFDAGVRSAPVDLTGGVKVTYAPIEDPRPAPAPVDSDFVASLDDLGLLMESLAPDQPPDGLVSLAAFEPVVDAFEEAAPAALEPMDFFEGPAPATLEPMDFFEGPAPVAPAEQPVAADEVPVTADPVPPLEPLVPPVEQPVTAAVAEPSIAPQYTVELLMPAARPADVQPEAVEQFSTLALLDLVAQLTPAEEPAKEGEDPAAGPGPEPAS